MLKYAVLSLTFIVVFVGAGAQVLTKPNVGRRGPGVAAAPPCDPKTCVCYADVGCFRKRAQCSENTAPLPQSPMKIGTVFSLYKRGNRGVTVLTAKLPATALYAAGFDARRPTMIAIHGWTQSALAFDGLKNVLLKKGDYNVILVNWEKGAGITGRWPLAYTQPVQNSRVVGKQIAMLVSQLRDVTGIDPGSVHLIGASLGAQAAGYAGQFLNGTVGRISGLDPSKPNFEGQPTNCKLDATDATFVDVIHTNMDVAGVAESVGHVDFFPNGGRTQPGCTSPICSHLRAKSYFRSSVWTDCRFNTHRCDGTPCGSRGCPSMGFNAFNPRDISRKGDFCLSTTERPPYCTDIKDKKATYPGKTIPGVAPSPPRRGNPNKPAVGSGTDKTTWFNHGKPLNPGGANPGWGNGGQRNSGNPGVGQGNKGTGIGTHAGNLPRRFFQDVEVNSSSGIHHHQTTFITGLAMILTIIMARAL